MHVRDDFPVIKNNPEIIYFDSGATTLKPKCVIDAVNEFLLQDVDAKYDYEQAVDMLRELFAE